MAFATLHSNLELSVVAPQHIQHTLTTKMNVRELGGLHVEGCKLERNPQINRVSLLPKCFDDFQATTHFSYCFENKIIIFQHFLTIQLAQRIQSFYYFAFLQLAPSEKRHLDIKAENSSIWKVLSESTPSGMKNTIIMVQIRIRKHSLYIPMQ